MENTFENVIRGESLKEPLIAAFREIGNILVHHSGPFATNCIIGSKWRQVNDVDEFTKDGINILKHLITSENTHARFASRLVRFIGIAVDSRCHDGTTTSMAVCCELAEIALEYIDRAADSPDRYRFAQDLQRLLGEVLTILADYRVTDDDILARAAEFGITTNRETVRSAIAYHMAMISSKGDRNLSLKIAEIIRKSPEKIYGLYRNIPLAVETDEPYVLKRQEHDLALRANLGHMEHFNHRNNTQYLSEDTVIFSTANQITKHSMEGAFLSAFVSTDKRIRADLADFNVEKGWEEYHEGKRRLVILSPMLDDNDLIEIFNEFNYRNPTIKISWFNYHVDHQLRTSFDKTLHFMAGVPLFETVMMQDPTQSMIGLGELTPRVHLLGSFLSISNLYTRDGESFHPFYRDPEAFPAYTEFVRETEDIIQFAQDNITNSSLDQHQLTTLTSFYRSLTSQDIYDIEVGGSKHDQLANQTVYEDAIGAALSAVSEGVVLGGYTKLAVDYNHEDASILERRLSQAFQKVVTDSLRVTNQDEGSNLFTTVANHPDSRWHYLIANQASYRPNAAASDYIEYACLDREGMEAFLNQEEGRSVLLQAYAGYHEQFKRFRNILPKLANTSHMVDMRTEKDMGLA